jgi:hypothetical protein
VRRLKLFEAFCFIMPAAAGLITLGSLIGAAAAECRAKPESSGPADSHWYYRIDRANQSRCWFLSSGDSRTRHTSSLKRGELAGRGAELERQEQSKLDVRTVAGPTPRALPSDEQMLGELAVPEFDSVTSESLVPRKVASISFAQPHVGEQNLRRETNLDLIFLCSALATALLVAGGVVQVIHRLHRRPRAASPKSPPLFKAKRSNFNALSSKGTKLNKLRARLSRSNIPSLRPRDMLLSSALSWTAVGRQHRASRLRSPSYLDRK